MNTERAEALSGATLDELVEDSLLDTGTDDELPSLFWLEVWLLGDGKVPSISEGHDHPADAMSSRDRWWRQAHVRGFRLLDERRGSVVVASGERQPEPATLVVLPLDRSYGFATWRDCLWRARELAEQGYRAEDLALYRRGRRIWGAS